MIYDGATGEVTLAPTFDVVTTTPYLPHDSMALTLEGTKRWPDARRLERFGVRRCQLSAAGAKAIIAEVAEAVATAARNLKMISDLDPEAKELPQHMRAAGDDGVASLEKGPWPRTARQTN